MSAVMLGALIVMAIQGAAQDAVFQPAQEQRVDVYIDGTRWMGTVITPLDAANREETYKVYTHLYGFDGKTPITKGAGGKYSHHRGLFIGWKDTMVNGKDIDSWHCQEAYQQHVKWLKQEPTSNGATQSQEINWYDDNNKPFIREVRTIAAHKSDGGARVFDFASELTSLAGKIELKGDLQHAGMQVRLANEVAHHEDSTQYTYPEGAKENENDEVVGAWWVLCSAEIEGKRIWLLQMTPQDHATGIPVYSVRRYARFGAFWEDTLEEGAPKCYRFRFVLSEKELDRAACDKLYAAYNAEKP